MKLNSVKAYMKKEFKELYRSKLIIMVYLLPSMILILFGYGIKLDVKHVRILILDYDQSNISRTLSEKFMHTQYFRGKAFYGSENAALRKIKQANADALLIIPSSFEKNLLKGLQSDVGVFVDTAFPTRGSTIESYIKGTILSSMAEILEEKGIPVHQAIVINERNLFNQAMRDENAIVPGLIGLVLLVAPAILSALLIVREKERGTIFNFYASPLSKGEFLLAKLTPVFLLHSLNIFILLLWALYLFHVPFRGSFFLYWLSSELYIIISLSLGMLISVVTKRQIVAVVLTIIITVLPGFIYSGILMPIASMQGFSKIEAHIFPVMYYNHIVYDTFLIGEGFHSEKIWLYLGIMILYIFVLLGSGIFLLKKEMK